MDTTSRRKLSATPIIILSTLIRKHSPDILGDYQRLKTLLNENNQIGKFDGEIYLLKKALKINIPMDLIDRSIDFERAVGQLREKFFIEEWAAKWAVASWAKALDIKKKSKRRQTY